MKMQIDFKKQVAYASWVVWNGTGLPGTGNRLTALPVLPADDPWEKSRQMQIVANNRLGGQGAHR